MNHYLSRRIAMSGRRKSFSFTKEEALQLLMPLMDLLTPVEREVFSSQLSIKTFRKDEPIYRENETPQFLLCLLSGKVKIFKHGVGNRNQIVRIFKPVDFFGYRAFLADEIFTTAASAFETSCIGYVPLQTVSAFIDENIRLSHFLMRRLSVLLGNADRRILSLTQKHVRGRLAESLLILKDNYGLEADRATLGIRLSREDLANLSNMTTANAIRTLSDFAAEGLVEVDGRNIKIINEDGLKAVSRMG